MGRAEIEARLNDLPRDTVLLIAARAALRSLPILTHSVERNDSGRTLALLTTRAVLHSVVKAKMPHFVLVPISPDLNTGNGLAKRSADIAAIDAAQSAIAATSAAGAGRDAVRAGFTATSIDRSADAASTMYYRNTSDFDASNVAAQAARNAAFVDASTDFKALLQAPVWHHSDEPDWLIKALKDRDGLFETGPEWAFWDRWYRGFVNGKHLDWDLQHKVALIRFEIWQAGPEAVAEEIARIEAAYNVEQSAAAVEKSALGALADRRGIGDNNPPAPIDEALETSDGTNVIWAAAHELREEAQASEPKKSRVVKALSAIIGVLKACGVYVAKKVDLALDTAIVAATKAAVVAGTGWLALNTETVQKLIQAVVNWLPYLG